MTEPSETEPPGSIYDQLCGALLTDPERLAAEIRADLDEWRAWLATWKENP